MKTGYGGYHSPFKTYPRVYQMGNLPIPAWNALWMLANGCAEVVAEEKDVEYIRVKLRPK